MSIPKRLRKQVGFVCSDLYVGFIHAAKEVFGKKVQIIVDRFHVAKLYGKGLDELRKKELARLRKTLQKSSIKSWKACCGFCVNGLDDLTPKTRNVRPVIPAFTAFTTSLSVKKRVNGSVG